LRAAGLNVETVAKKRGDPDALNFSSDQPKVMSFHAAKGLTFDSVLMPRLVDSSFRRWTQVELNRMLFVGITRAIKWVYMSTNDGGVLRGNRQIQDLFRAGALSIQRARTGMGNLFETGPAGAKPAQQKKDDGLGGLL
jgi:superfamily I DNA/RNA helicase